MEQNKNTYYFAELSNKNSYAKSEALKACTLTAAKLEAARKQVFQGTILEIGLKHNINEEGFILKSESTKIDGKWSS